MTNRNQISSQRDVLDFLNDPRSYPASLDKVEIHETHGAMVFLAGDYAFKIKKAVKFPYMDFSTLEKRRYICEQEFAINQPSAPQIYCGVVAITKETNGRLAFDGSGEVVEWAVKMKRFDQGMILDNLPHARVAEKTLIDSLANAVFDYHKEAPVELASDGPRRIQLLIDELVESFQRSPEVFPIEEVVRFNQMAEEHLSRVYYCLRLRGRRGFIRRCHGDLHLRNIVLMDEKPVLFDALEFDEELATIDVLYDLAFLLMDLDQRQMSPSANQLLNRYLYLSRRVEDIYGIKAMPLFLAIRAGVRAMVANDHAQQLSGEAAEEEITSARDYFFTSLQYLTPKQPTLVAIGGFSGTGKTTLASLLAGTLEHAPGFLHFRTDLERKALFNAAETERLDPSYYTQDISDQVYDRLLHKARIGLKAGQRVIVDAVFSKEREREEFQALAREFNIPFIGIWLEADERVIAERVEARKGDASDATSAVVHQQVKRGVSALAWHRIDASGSEFDTLRQVLNLAEISSID